MLKPFTKDYEDNSSEAGFQFTFSVIYAIMPTEPHLLNR